MMILVHWSTLGTQVSLSLSLSPLQETRIVLFPLALMVILVHWIRAVPYFYLNRKRRKTGVSLSLPCSQYSESPASSMAEGMKPELCEEEEEEGSEEEEERREMVEILHQQILGKTVSMKRFEGEEAKQNLIWRCKSKMANFVFNFEEEEDADYDEMMMLRKSLERAHVRVWGPSTNFDNTPQQHHKKPVPAPAEDAHLLHNPHSLEVSSGYLASNDSICEASESTSARYNHNSKAENGTLDNTECGQMDIKLCAWKEYEIMKIFAKLNRKENKINDWECKKKTQARNRFNKVQMNLDIKRQKALEAMEKRTAKIEKRADVKRVRERSRSMRKTSRIEAVTGSIRTTGNIPWKLWLF
ncbi:uncharacterized protein LOC18428826 isoform X3 [Amborella trichopoda]|uniref:uncharacterized protein LOC18428826 isoform X3 n=1 Tax=Amborella trichopoda TaxID=13333 RepID=UPI0009BEBCAA|nr:uncharacterized protein LOC18428826 isoform X3 [Amborella trichopoda]|eukprot:XP_020519654.1 uncharacterized protein LOC18428826 isoform X3 [Amborella trichopoda]